MSVALITGVSGFLGPQLARELRSSGVRVVGMDVTAGDTGAALDDFVEADVARIEEVAAAIDACRPDTVFHLAGVMSADETLAQRVNVTGTANVLEVVRRQRPITRVVVTGSAAEYGTAPLGSPPFAESANCSPRSVYGRTKLAATKAAQEAARAGVRVVVVRPFNIVGAGMRESLVVGALVSRALAAIRSGQRSLRVGNLEAERDFIDVADVARGCIAAAARGSEGEIYNLCTGRAVSIRDVAERIVALAGRELSLSVDPVLNRGADASVGVPDKARGELGFVARIPLDQSLADTWQAALHRAEKCASVS